MKVEFELDEVSPIRAAAEQALESTLGPRGMAANRLAQMMRDFVASPEGEELLLAMMRAAIDRCGPALVEGIVRAKLKDYIRTTANKLEAEQSLFSGFAVRKTP